MRPGLLAACLLVFALACGSAAPVQVPTTTPLAVSRIPKPRPPPTAIVSPTPSPSPTPPPTPAPAIDVSGHPRQGGFLFVRLLNAPAGSSPLSVSLDGRTHQMLHEDAGWFTVIGVATDFTVGDHTIEIAGDSGVIAAGLVTINEGGFQYESIELPPSSTDLLNDQAAVAAERETLAQTYAVFTPGRFWSGAWLMPAQGTITNTFGLQRSINGGPYFGHTGTDVANEKGTVVVAAASGHVVLARPLYLYGNAVVIDHGAGVFTSYNHLDAITVSEGQTITVGDLVGLIGETGFVSGAHLHWEAIIGGVRTDPTLWTLAAVEP